VLSHVGKYVVPAPLEDHLCRSRYVFQAFLYGDNRNVCVALVVPEMAEVREWAQKKGVNCETDAQLLQTEAVNKLFSSEV